MFERFTDQARACIAHAQEEAVEHQHNFIGTEHFLLGLIRDEQSTAAQVLTSLGVRLADLRADTDAIIGRGAYEVTRHIPFTPRAKKVLELSLREALHLGHTHIGSEHLLLSLVREGNGIGAQVLLARGLVHSRIVARVAPPDGQENEPLPVIGGPETYDAGDLTRRLAAILARLVSIEERLRAS